MYKQLIFLSIILFIGQVFSSSCIFGSGNQQFNFTLVGLNKTYSYFIQDQQNESNYTLEWTLCQNSNVKDVQSTIFYNNNGTSIVSGSFATGSTKISDNVVSFNYLSPTVFNRINTTYYLYCNPNQTESYFNFYECFANGLNQECHIQTAYACPQPSQELYVSSYEVNPKNRTLVVRGYFGDYYLNTFIDVGGYGCEKFYYLSNSSMITCLIYNYSPNGGYKLVTLSLISTTKNFTNQESVYFPSYTPNYVSNVTMNGNVFVFNGHFNMLQNGGYVLVNYTGWNMYTECSIITLNTSKIECYLPNYVYGNQSIQLNLFEYKLNTSYFISNTAPYRIESSYKNNTTLILEGEFGSSLPNISINGGPCIIYIFNQYSIQCNVTNYPTQGGYFPVEITQLYYNYTLQQNVYFNPISLEQQCMDSTNNCSGNGYCNFYGTCVCYTPSNYSNCYQTPQEKCIYETNNCQRNGYCDFYGQCHCYQPSPYSNCAPVIQIYNVSITPNSPVISIYRSLPYYFYNERVYFYFGGYPIQCTIFASNSTNLNCSIGQYPNTSSLDLYGEVGINANSSMGPFQTPLYLVYFPPGNQTDSSNSSDSSSSSSSFEPTVVCTLSRGKLKVVYNGNEAINCSSNGYSYCTTPGGFECQGNSVNSMTRCSAPKQITCQATDITCRVAGTMCSISPVDGSLQIQPYPSNDPPTSTTGTTSSIQTSGSPSLSSLSSPIIILLLSIISSFYFF
ncbi:hypothetical protein DFA_02346 [Cavenderia fasciculata]|uniref:EGF-like domain-containing protein n=1 Tax=Cavenderia fasciculata TaxID=261658 RepID=F4PZ71_CACFS|nr:uncharacterized protein DFA_02346 [Cavenderia fasciculata]EGG19100.1 hypothetical protein DFA_02346 [Cavenderia fasciculata]|eukprot:XP_004366733.1 hypothetical protein DFA_02346 [Cavenderia fasciculata]